MRLETHGSNSSSMPGSRSKPVLYPENFRLGAIQQQSPGIDHVNRFVLPSKLDSRQARDSPVKYSIRLIRQARNGNRTNRILLRLLLGLEVKTRSNQEGIPASLAFPPPVPHFRFCSVGRYSPTKRRNGAFLLAEIHFLLRCLISGPIGDEERSSPIGPEMRSVCTSLLSANRNTRLFTLSLLDKSISAQQQR